MGRTQILAFPISGTDKILLFLGKVRCAALIHLAAALGAKYKAGENTHVAHFGRAAAGSAYVLHNEEYAFFHNRRLRVLKD